MGGVPGPYSLYITPKPLENVKGGWEGVDAFIVNCPRWLGYDLADDNLTGCRRVDSLELKGIGR